MHSYILLGFLVGLITGAVFISFGAYLMGLCQ